MVLHQDRAVLDRDAGRNLLNYLVAIKTDTRQAVLTWKAHQLLGFEEDFLVEQVYSCYSSNAKYLGGRFHKYEGHRTER